MKKLGIYIHIPFCLSKCLYCGFFSAQQNEDVQAAYVEQLLCDIKEYGKVYGQHYSADTIFIGGGTPSILPAAQTERMIEGLRQNFYIEDDAEITLEANPKTLTKDKLISYRQAGINRLSIGLQSFSDEILKTLGRAHTGADFYETFRLARACGFDNINIDLMFSVPGHNMKIWEDTLRKTIELSPEHISFYSLQLEEGTPFFEMFQRGEIEEVPDRLDRQMYHRAIQMLKEAGYAHYEISNCAKPGYQCRHNLKYWSLEDYLGIGQSAASYLEGVRFTEAPCMEFHPNRREDDMSEFVFTGLRKTCGISLAAFEERFGEELWQVYRRQKENLEVFFRQGLLIEEDEMLRLSEEGLDVSNKIMAEFV